MRVCLDTNVLVAAFAARGLCADVLRVCLTDHELVIGEVHLKELRRALRDKLKLPEDRIEAAEAVFAGMALIAKPVEPAAIEIRDPDDRWILATAIVGKADCLVTGDKDLLTLQNLPLPILNPRSFWERLRRSP